MFERNRLAVGHQSERVDPQRRGGSRTCRPGGSADQGEDATALDALAAAYAETGRFPEAVQTAAKALNLAERRSDRSLAEAISARIAFYKAKTPFRDRSPTE